MRDAALFTSGHLIAHRDIYRGRVWYARAEVVVEDTKNRTLLYWTPGSEVHVPVSLAGGFPLRIPKEPWVLESRPWHSFHVLCYWHRGDRSSVWLFWEAGTWRFDGWYVNLQSPFVRTPLGFDSTDDILDVKIQPDGVWSWKDDDELEEAVRAEVVSTSAASGIRTEGWRAIRRMKQAREPFTSTWVNWRPDERWRIGRLPDGWASLPTSI